MVEVSEAVCLGDVFGGQHRYASNTAVSGRDQNKQNIAMTQQQGDNDG